MGIPAFCPFYALSSALSFRRGVGQRDLSCSPCLRRYSAFFSFVHPHVKKKNPALFLKDTVGDDTPDYSSLMGRPGVSFLPAPLRRGNHRRRALRRDFFIRLYRKGTPIVVSAVENQKIIVKDSSNRPPYITETTGGNAGAIYLDTHRHRPLPSSFLVVFFSFCTAAALDLRQGSRRQGPHHRSCRHAS